MKARGWLGVGLCVAAGSAVWWLANPSIDAQLSFDAALWRQSSPDRRDRLRMLQSLLEKHPLVGLQRSAVESLLGPPDYDQWNSSAPHPWYDLGWHEDWLDMESIGLVVAYDADGTVAGYSAVPFAKGGVATGQR